MEISQKAVIGKDDFLFLGGADSNDLIAHISGDVKITAAALKVLRHNAAILNQLTCSKLLLVVPEAHVVYQDLLPDEIKVSEDRPVMQALPVLGAAAVYPLQKLRNLRAKGVCVYSGNDSHWTETAAFETYISLRSRLNRTGKFKYFYEPLASREAGDLRSGSPRQVIEKEMAQRKNYTSGVQNIFSNGMLNHGSASVIVNPRGTGRCLAFGTSFSTRLVPAYGCDFRETIFCYGTAIDPALVDLVKPDAVIVEMPERFIHYPTAAVRGGTFVSALMASQTPGYKGILHDLTQKVSQNTESFIKAQRLLCRPAAALADLGLFNEAEYRSVEAEKIQAVLGIIARGVEMMPLRMLASGQFRRNVILYSIFGMIDRGEISLEDRAIIPDTEMGGLALVRLLIRGGKGEEALQVLAHTKEAWGTSPETEYYDDYLGKLVTAAA